MVDSIGFVDIAQQLLHRMTLGDSDIINDACEDEKIDFTQLLLSSTMTPPINEDIELSDTAEAAPDLQVNALPAYMLPIMQEKPFLPEVINDPPINLIGQILPNDATSWEQFLPFQTEESSTLSPTNDLLEEDTPLMTVSDTSDSKESNTPQPSQEPSQTQTEKDIASPKEAFPPVGTEEPISSPRPKMSNESKVFNNAEKSAPSPDTHSPELKTPAEQRQATTAEKTANKIDKMQATTAQQMEDKIDKTRKTPEVNDAPIGKGKEDPISANEEVNINDSFGEETNDQASAQHADATPSHGQNKPSDHGVTQAQQPFDAELKNIPKADKVGPQEDIIPQLSEQLKPHNEPGTHSVRIQLYPESLGQVDVNLTIDDTTYVTARIHAESPQTAQFLQENAQQLEQALQEAGLHIDSNSLSFDFGEQQAQHQDFATTDPQGQSSSYEAVNEAIDEQSTPTHPQGDHQVDIKV